MAKQLSDTKTAEDLSDDMTKDVLPLIVFIGLEIFAGFFGNILILLVYSRKYKRINFRYFVLALAIVDLTSCCTTLPLEIYSLSHWYTFEHGWICKVKSYFHVFTVWASASVLLSLAVDRYRKICHPFKWQIRVHVAFKLCGCCFLISAIMAIPVVVLRGKHTYTFDFHGENVTVSICEKASQYVGTNTTLIYITSAFLAPVGVIIAVVMTLNFIMARKLFGQSMISNIKKTHLTKPAKATELTTDSAKTTEIAVGSLGLDTDINEESIGVPTHFLEEKSQNASVKHVDLEISVNRSTSNHTKNETNILHEKGTELLGSDTDRSSLSKQTSEPADCRKVVDKANERSQARNSLADKNSTDEESSGNFSGNLQSDDSPADNVSSDIAGKRQTPERKRYRKRKTMIMLILTSIFAVTMVLYGILTMFVAKPDGILKGLSDSKRAAFFFFWRLYYINSVVNPILYGFMDPRFRSGLRSYIPLNTSSSSYST